MRLRLPFASRYPVSCQRVVESPSWALAQHRSQELIASVSETIFSKLFKRLHEFLMGDTCHTVAASYITASH